MNQSQLMPAVNFGTTDPAAIAAAEGAKARIQAAYIMALQKPRNPDQARVDIIEACKRPEFAEKVEFSKPVGNRKIRGPSIRFAEVALKCWQNIDTETQVIFEDEKIRRIKVRVLDLETNSSFSKDINIGKTVERKNAIDREVIGERTNSQGEKVYIVLATEDELSNKEGALISKAIRNEGLRLIPQDIIDEAVATARATIRNRDAKDPNAAKKSILDAFAGIGIKPIELERYLKHSLDTIAPVELEDLRGIYRAIRDGETNWNELIEPKEDEKPPAPLDVDPDTGEWNDVFKTKDAPPELTGKTEVPPADQPIQDDDEAEYKAKVAKDVFETCRTARKLFAEHIRVNIEIIKNDMTPIQRADLKTKWLRSAREEVNGVKKDEPWPLDPPPEKPSGDINGEASNSSSSSEVLSQTEDNETPEYKSSDKKLNGFVYCPRDEIRVSENVCEDCPDHQGCENEKHFFSECKIFDDTLGGIVFRSVLRKIANVDDPQKVPVDKRQDVLIELNAAVDQQNA